VAVKKLEEDEIAWHELHLIGISTTFKGYTLCFHLNQLLGAEFQRLKDHNILLKGKQTTTIFQVFGWNDEAQKAQLYLFDNRNGNDFLLPEAAGVDFILRVNGNMKTKKLIQELKALKEVSVVIPLSAIKIKSLKNLDYNESD